MSQLISEFIIEPVVRQARRFSRRDSTNAAAQATTPATANEFPDYIDPLTDSDTLTQGADDLDGFAEDIGARPRVERRQDDTEDFSIEIRARAVTDSEISTRQQGSLSLVEEQLSLFRERAERIERLSRSATWSTRNEAGFHMMGDSTMSTTSSNTRTSGGTPVADSKLPEDDGMGHMRKRILEVHDSQVSSDEKSRLVHQIMLEQYISSGGDAGLRAQSPSSIPSHERPYTPNSRHSAEASGADFLETSTSSAIDELTATAEDLKPTYWIPPPSSLDATPEQSRKNSLDTEKHFGCEHYKRNVKLQCSACLKWYTCRFCHDRVENHCLNRRATKNMLCMKCGVPQPAAADCSSCGFCAANYYCKICKLWDDDATKSIYHCDACGICRRGKGLGKDFFHCQKCSACVSMQLLDNHKCIERSMDSDCPICGEYMFTSLKTVVFMRCGHTIHYQCWREHMKNSYKCPICSMSMVNMDLTFRQYDNDIEAQPMPPQFRDTKASIFCNDCTNKSSVPFHWVGLKCPTCDSYNTTRLQIISAPENVDLGDPETDQPVPTPPAVISRHHALPPNSDDNTTAPVIVSEIMTTSGASDETGRLRSVVPASGAALADIDTLGTADEEDDVDFWGGTSPRERAMLEAQMRDQGGSESEESTDEEIDMMNEDEDEEDDEMAIFGHR